MLSMKEECLINLDKGIEDKTQTGELEVEFGGMLEYQECIIVGKARVSRHIRKAWESESVQVSNASTISEILLHKQTVNLLKLEIERFDGEISHWQEFWSQYDTTIHNNDALCKRDKFFLPDVLFNWGSSKSRSRTYYD